MQFCKDCHSCYKPCGRQQGVSMSVRAISVTRPIEGALPEGLTTIEQLIAYCARVSSPMQHNPDSTKLLKYCFDHGHLSVFSMADLTVEITTSRAIAAQLLRHSSFQFQEFSQRYAVADLGFEPVKARRQDFKNRQNSIDNVSDYDQGWFQSTLEHIQDMATAAYEKALYLNIAKESARFLLPLNTRTKLYMKGSLRSWVTYLQVRTDPSTQLEHREIAEQIKVIVLEHFPTLKELL